MVIDFVDARQKAREHPDTYHVVSVCELASLKPGDLVKVSTCGEATLSLLKSDISMTWRPSNFDDTLERVRRLLEARFGCQVEGRNEDLVNKVHEAYKCNAIRR